MQPRILLDEHFSGEVAQALSRHGVDAVATSTVRELRGLPDEVLLEEAARQNRMLVTYNVRDFAELGRRWAHAGRSHTGILLIHPRTAAPGDFGAQVRVILETLKSIGNRETTDLVLFAVPGKPAED